jgi:non-ribosomal peptide synthetase component F
MASAETFDGLSGLSPEDQVLLSRFGRGPSLPTPSQLVHEAFERIADSHPDILAAKYGDRSITYQQLDIAANRLANYLISSGLMPRQRVCLVVSRSLEMLVGIMAILKAGCQYVPIDGGVASDQALQHIFTDTGARFVLCLSKFWDRTRRFTSKHTIIVAFDMDTGAYYPADRPAQKTLSNDGAYAIYTSGMIPL